MKKLSIIAALLLGASVASAQTTTTQEDIKAYVNDQITDAVTQLSKTDGDLQTQIKTLEQQVAELSACLLYTSPSPRDRQKSRMPSSA